MCLDRVAAVGLAINVSVATGEIKITVCWNLVRGKIPSLKFDFLGFTKTVARLYQLNFVP